MLIRLESPWIRAFLAGLAHIIGMAVVVFGAPLDRTPFNGIVRGSPGSVFLEDLCVQGRSVVDMNATFALVFLILPGLLIGMLLGWTVPSISIPFIPLAIVAIAISTALFSYYGSLISDRKGAIVALILALLYSGVAFAVTVFFGSMVAIGCAG